MNSRPHALRALAIATVTTLFVVGMGTMGRSASPARADDSDGLTRTDADTVAARGVVTDSLLRSSLLVRAAEAATANRSSRAGSSVARTALARLVAHAANQAQRAEAQRKRALARAGAPFSFTFAAFNILGSNHTAPGSDADQFASGRVRTEWAADVARAHGMDIIGFSEIQGDQLSAFLRTTGYAYDVWPGTALGGKGIPASLMWRKDRFTAVSKSSLSIPFTDGERPMPVVRLKENASGREFYVINAHNAPQGMQTARNIAIAREINLINSLRSQYHLPVFFSGDLNEKEAAVCKVTSQTDLVAASPMGNYEGCSGWRGMRIDWLFGSDVSFSGYVQDRSSLVRRVTDHAVVVAEATVS